MFLTTWLVAKFFILRQRFFPLKILSYVGSLVALGDLRFAPPLPTLPFIISRACLLVPPQPAVILLGNICYRGGETASYPATRSCWVKLLLRTQLVGARSNPYRKATETLRMKFSSNFEETGFEFLSWTLARGLKKLCSSFISECREYLTVSLASVSN